MRHSEVGIQTKERQYWHSNVSLLHGIIDRAYLFSGGLNIDGFASVRESMNSNAALRSLRLSSSSSSSPLGVGDWLGDRGTWFCAAEAKNQRTIKMRVIEGVPNG